MKYMKKPIVVEAFQYVGDLIYPAGGAYVPEWAITAYQNGILCYMSLEDEPPELYVRTLEGNLHVSEGDYIIRGIEGEMYPCKPDIFEETYARVDE